MTVLTNSPEARAQLSRRDVPDRPLTIVALCAAWCNTCAEFRAVFETIAADRPGATFLWLDIEDDAELCGDLDVENFPTLLAFRGERMLHYGVTLPLAGLAARLVDELDKRDQALTDVDATVTALHRALVGARREG